MTSHAMAVAAVALAGSAAAAALKLKTHCGSGSEEWEEGEEDDEDGEAEEDEELGEALTQCFCGEEPTRDMLECSNPECKHVSIHRSCTLLAGGRAAPPAGWLCKVCRGDTRGHKKRGRG